MCIVCFREQDIFNQAISRGQDGRRDLLERKFCNFITGVDQNCGEDLVGQCYDEKQVQVWADMNLEVILDQAESLFTLYRLGLHEVPNHEVTLMSNKLSFDFFVS